jgi:hypothetical protein
LRAEHNGAHAGAPLPGVLPQKNRNVFIHRGFDKSSFICLMTARSALVIFYKDMNNIPPTISNGIKS